jgi:hypothetical protein
MATIKTRGFGVQMPELRSRLRVCWLGGTHALPDATKKAVWEGEGLGHSEEKGTGKGNCFW